MLGFMIYRSDIRMCTVALVVTILFALARLGVGLVPPPWRSGAASLISLHLGWRLAFTAGVARAEVDDHARAGLPGPRPPASGTRWQRPDSSPRGYFLRSYRDFLRLFFTAPRILR